MSTRPAVKKTCRLYIGGKLQRGENGRCLPLKSAGRDHLDNCAHASRKDIRDAVVVARATRIGTCSGIVIVKGLAGNGSR